MANERNDPKPFLRWAGGKQWLISGIDEYLPKKFKNYHEPFLGGGSIFIYLKSRGLIQGNTTLSDLNPDLINAYNKVRDNIDEVIKKLRTFTNDEPSYYQVREKRFKSPVSQAAQFIYLNRTSYNGIYRVNLNGKYNVPYGHKKYAELFDFTNLRLLSTLFRDCTFANQDFYSTLDNISTGDLVFLDPPYTVAHEHNGFVKYNQKIFQWADQERLKEFIDILKKRKVHFILTNAAHQSINDLYNNIGEQFKLSRYSVIGGKSAKRDKYHEYLFKS